MKKVIFPEIATKNQATNLSKKGEKAIRSGHPWIFESAVTKLSEDAKNGDRAIIFDSKKNKFMGLGLVDLTSPIRIKVLFSGKKANFNQEWIQEKMILAFEKRQELLEGKTDSFRLIYGENDQFPGLIVDCYGSVVVMKLYSPIWMPYMNQLVESIQYIFTIKASTLQAIVLRLSRNMAQFTKSYSEFTDGSIIAGELPDETIVFEEYGVKFSANVIHGHKTGYFLDHRDNRRQVGAYAKNKKVLDVFSYAGGFSVHALVGQAKSVTSVDISKQALDLAKENAALNGNFKQYKTLAGDAFAIMKDLSSKGEKYDLIVVDPPSFAKSAAEISGAIHSYKRLARLTVPLAAKNAILVMASCSSRVDSDTFFDIIETEIRHSRRSYRIIKKTFHDIDHPITFPEGAYLKTIYVELQ